MFSQFKLTGLNQPFVSMILGSLGFTDRWKIPALTAHPLQAMAKSLSWNLQVLSKRDNFPTLSPATPITNILCIHAILNLPGFTGLCRCTELFLGVESSPFLARPPASPRAREASSSSTPKPGFPPCVFGKASAAYPPTLQAELVIPFLSWNKALYILPIVLHLFCLRVCLPNMMLGSWEQGYVIRLHP